MDLMMMETAHAAEFYARLASIQILHRTSLNELDDLLTALRTLIPAGRIQEVAHTAATNEHVWWALASAPDIFAHSVATVAAFVPNFDQFEASWWEAIERLPEVSCDTTGTGELLVSAQEMDQMIQRELLHPQLYDPEVPTDSERRKMTERRRDAWGGDYERVILRFVLGGLHREVRLLIHAIHSDLSAPTSDGLPIPYRESESLVAALQAGASSCHRAPRSIRIPPHLVERPCVFTLNSKGNTVTETVERQFVSPGILEALRQQPFPFGVCLCGTVFVHPPIGKRRRFCSERCKARGIPSAAKRAEYARNLRQRRSNSAVLLQLKRLFPNKSAGEIQRLANEAMKQNRKLRSRETQSARKDVTNAKRKGRTVERREKENG
jgi:hypothetical protein